MSRPSNILAFEEAAARIRARRAGALEACASEDAADAFIRTAGLVPRDDPEAMAVIERIVSALDGDPRALALAGVRVPVMGLESVALQLTEMPGRLLGDDPELARALDGKLVSLGTDERYTLLALVVARGGLTVDAVAEIARLELGATGSALGVLAQRRLIHASERGEAARFHAFGAVRERLAQEALAEVGLAHAEHLERIAIGIAASPRDVDRRRAALPHRVELGNLDTALAHADRLSAPAHRRTQLAVRIAVARDALTCGRSFRGPIRAALDQALERATLEVPLAMVGRALVARAGKDTFAGRHAAAAEDASQAQQIGELLEDEGLVASGMLGRAIAIRALGSAGESGELAEAAVSAFAEVGDARWEAMAWREAALASWGDGDGDAAQRQLARAAEVVAGPGSDGARAAIAIARHGVAVLAGERAACAELDALVARARALDDLDLELAATAAIGFTALVRHDAEVARVNLSDAITLARRARALAALPLLHAARGSAQLLSDWEDDAERSLERSRAVGREVGDLEPAEMLEAALAGERVASRAWLEHALCRW